ncbi:MAG: glycosyltransferase family 39 protein [Saprospiraceae bacterium]|nr:glycosyltransferase family 39 protein [Saprospiraceae bacterium]
MLNRIVNSLAICFTVYWIAFIFLEYWTWHPDVREAITLFQFGGAALTLCLLAAGGGWLFLRSEAVRRRCNGLTIAGLGLVVILILLNAFFRVSLNAPLTASENVVFIGTMLRSILPAYGMLAVCFVLGSAVMHVSSVRMPAGDFNLVKIGLGMMVVVFALFVLGAAGLLQAAVLIPVLVAVLVIGWRYAWQFVRTTLLNPIPVGRDFNALGFGVFFILLTLVGMNLVQVVRPVPLGYDAITLYVNLASLIDDYEGLVQGNQPYNWSLFISLGYLLFGKTETVLTLSFLGTLLSLFALYRVSRKWVNSNYALLVVLLFYTMPMVNWLSFRDVKIDLGLLFYSLVILLLLYNWLAPEATKSKKKRKKSAKKQRPAREWKWAVLSGLSVRIRDLVTRFSPPLISKHQYPVLIGLFCGFAMGIKLSALLVILGLVAALWYFRDGGIVALLGACAISIFLILAARLDQQANLRQFHTSAHLVQWSMLLAGIAAFGYLLLRKRAVFLANLRITVIISVFTVATMAPWLAKNYLETRSLSVTALTNGKRASPSPTVREMDRIWRTSQTGQQQ